MFFVDARFECHRGRKTRQLARGGQAAAGHRGNRPGAGPPRRCRGCCCSGDAPRADLAASLSAADIPARRRFVGTVRRRRTHDRLRRGLGGRHLPFVVDPAPESGVPPAAGRGR